jgi:MHS family proline/betaine transporter-like MFS transporter
VIGLMIIFNIGYYVVFTFLPTYFIKTLHSSKTNAFVSITLASLVALVLILPQAALSDRVGRRPMLIAGSLAFAIFGYPMFLLLNSGSLVAAIAAHCGLAVIEAVYVSSAVAVGVELFAKRVTAGSPSASTSASPHSAAPRPTWSRGSQHRLARTWRPRTTSWSPRSCRC